MGRRWGKTVLGGALVGNALRQHGRVAWIAPTYKNTRPMWRWLVASTISDVRARKMTVHKAEHAIETAGGGFLGLYSGDNIDSIRGEAFHLAVVDEAARIDETAYTDAIMPTLADFGGDIVLISSPKGRNWFYMEWMRGQAGDSSIKSWQAPTSANPNPNIRQAFEAVRHRVPERTFQQEWLAEFVESGGVFRKFREAATATPQEIAFVTHSYAIGVDWGKFNDFTVFAVLNLNTKQLVHLERSNKVDYVLQMQRLEALCKTFRPVTVIAERNSIGEPLIEQLERQGLPIQPFITTNATKALAIDALSLAFERDELKILNDPTLIAELQAYEMERLPSGLLRYGAPEGMHDDTVMALALAWQAIGEQNYVWN